MMYLLIIHNIAEYKMNISSYTGLVLTSRKVFRTVTQCCRMLSSELPSQNSPVSHTTQCFKASTTRRHCCYITSSSDHHGGGFDGKENVILCRDIQSEFRRILSAGCVQCVSICLTQISKENLVSWQPHPPLVSRRI
jgi:hypothetical protein